MWESKRLVTVEWSDAACDGTWQEPGAQFTPAKCVSVGWVMQDDEVVVLAGTFSEHGSFNQIVIIPRGMVTSMEDASAKPVPVVTSVAELDG